MERKKGSVRSRRNLDGRFQQLGFASRFRAPVRGWIKAVREGLGMSSEQLAKRLGIKQPSVIALEQSEAKGTIELNTLRRVAAAMDCEVVYALIPKKPLETMVRDQARNLLRKRRAAIEHSMALEDQTVEGADFEALVDEFVRETKPSRLWDEV